MPVLETTRYIRNTGIPTLDTAGAGSAGSATDHTHVNKLFLDNLNIDVEGRITYVNQVVSIPVIEDSW